MGKPKLTVEQVLEARLRYAAGEKEWMKLSWEYGVHYCAIRKAAMGESFKHLPMPGKKR